MKDQARSQSSKLRLHHSAAEARFGNFRTSLPLAVALPLVVGLVLLALIVALILLHRNDLDPPVYLQILLAFFIPFVIVNVWWYVSRYIEELYEENDRNSGRSRSLRDRLQELRQLADQGLISAGEYDSLREVALADHLSISIDRSVSNMAADQSASESVPSIGRSPDADM